MLGRWRKGKCGRIQRMLSSYLDKRLAHEEQKMVEHHVMGCEACQKELDSLQEIVSLLHRVPMVTPRRSFAIAEAKPVPRPVTFGRLRMATAVLALILAILVGGDLFHIYPTEPGVESAAKEEPRQQEMLAEGAPQPAPLSMGESEDIDLRALPEEEVTAEDEEYRWPVREIELAMLGITLALGGIAIASRHRNRKGVKSDVK
jgi:hypothetical protein